MKPRKNGSSKSQVRCEFGLQLSWGLIPPIPRCQEAKRICRGHETQRLAGFEEGGTFAGKLEDIRDLYGTLFDLNEGRVEKDKSLDDLHVVVCYPFNFGTGAKGIGADFISDAF